MSINAPVLAGWNLVSYIHSAAKLKWSSLAFPARFLRACRSFTYRPINRLGRLASCGTRIRKRVTGPPGEVKATPIMRVTPTMGVLRVTELFCDSQSKSKDKMSSMMPKLSCQKTSQRQNVPVKDKTEMERAESRASWNYWGRVAPAVTASCTQRLNPVRPAHMFPASEVECIQPDAALAGQAGRKTLGKAPIVFRLRR